jgi:hypothetical protein
MTLGTCGKVKAADWIISRPIVANAGLAEDRGGM